MNGLDEMIRALIREEIHRLIRPDAIAANDELVSAEDRDLQRQALDVANRLRRARRA